MFNGLPIPALALLTAVTLAAGAAPAAAQQCAHGHGAPCRTSADCEGNVHATLCVEGTSGDASCQIPCVGDDGSMQRAACSMGETCVEGVEPGLGGGETYYCAPSKFSMDLNLLDSCVLHFLQGMAPDLSGRDPCSLSNNLSQLLDQNGDGVFNIYDADLCVKAFLREAPCDQASQSCDAGQVYCDDDGACGAGLFCDRALHRCSRQCGLIVDRSGANELRTLDRKCAGRLRTCDYDTGRCVEAALEENHCQVDQDCPSGAYCFLGQCQARCYRSLDCPDAAWFCGGDNTCRPRPPLVASEGDEQEAQRPRRPFDPKDFSITFATKRVTLDPLNDSHRVPLLVMDLVSKRQAVGRDDAVFGYRTELTYGSKQDAKCLKDPEELSAAERDDCVVDEQAGEGFLSLDSPFGVLYGADDDPTVDVRINHQNTLSAGLWEAYVDIFFTNGNRSRVTVTYHKPSPSGEYGGWVNVYAKDSRSRLTSSNLGVRIHVADGNDGSGAPAEIKEWDAWLEENGIRQEKLFHDRNRGYVIRGLLHGGESALFAAPGALDVVDNEVPLIGMYEPGRGRMRLLAVIDIKADQCWSEDGSSVCEGSSERLQVENPFGRDLRRYIELIGTYDEQTRRLDGTFRETLYGLTPSPATLDGAFHLSQIKQDTSPAEQGGLALVHTDGVAFPRLADVVAGLSDELGGRKGVCGGFPDALRRLGSSARFQKYMLEEYQRAPAVELPDLDDVGEPGAFHPYAAGPTLASDADRGPIFPRLQRFEQRLSAAVANLQNPNQAFLTLGDFFQGMIRFCEDEGGDTGGGCVSRAELECGLGLYRRAILNGWHYQVADGVQGGLAGAGKQCSPTANCDAGGELCCDAQAGEVCVDNLCVLSCAEEDPNPADDQPPQADPTRCDAVPGTVCQPADSGPYDADAAREDPTVNRRLFLCRPLPKAKPLFCTQLPGHDTSPGGCSERADQEPALVTLQEHNRFFKELVQTHNFTAQNAVSDAFLALYRAASGTPLDEASAYDYKAAKLDAALSHFDAVRAAIMGTPAAAVLFQWPMGGFATRGHVWLKQMHQVLADRMQVLLDRIDLRRRVASAGGARDLMYAHQVLQYEYLQQVYLMRLQRAWQGPGFRYEGQAEELLDLANHLLRKANDSRNPFGLHPNRIYFENSALELSNWQNFRKRLEAEIEPFKADVEEALAEMRGALASQDALEDTILGEQHQLSAQLDDFCGRDVPLPDACSVERPEIDMSCRRGDPGCMVEFQCDDDLCEDVVKTFQTSLAQDEWTCRASARPFTVEVDGVQRNCTRGRVGALEQEKISLEQQRQGIVRRLQSLLREVARQQEQIAHTQTYHEALNEVTDQYWRTTQTATTTMMLADFAYSLVDLGLQAAECNPPSLGGVGDCPGKIAGSAGRMAAKVVRDEVEMATSLAKMDAERIKDVELTRLQQNEELRGERMKLDNLLTDVENVIGDYQAVTQQIFNIDVQISDARFQVEQIAKRYRESIENVLDHLIGRASGSMLRRNEKLMAANRRFDRMLIEAYKMTRAFIHRYNFESHADNWTNRVYKIVTLQDLQDFIAFLDDVEANYCGSEGLDCDYVHNGEVFRYSVREQMFPHLRDIVDPDTGEVLTAGQQFHNLITGSGFVKRRARPQGLSDQIELPFAIWLNDRGDRSGAPQRFMVGAGDCNHIIRGSQQDSGTVAVNILGTRIPKTRGVKFELWRGNTDYIRSCSDRDERGQPAIHTYIVGWAPSSRAGQLDNPPSFITQSGELPACINSQQLDDPATVDTQAGCFHYFARDRSLGAPDYTLVIPQLDGDQGWLRGEGVPEEQRPVIEDIVLYFRYNDRPITSE